MERVNRILRHPRYADCLKQVKDCENGRIFCRHQMEHFLDVARIAYILNLEEGRGLAKDMIYAAALLHDCGRYVQYTDGTPHEEASSAIAPGILKDCGFVSREIEEITEAISAHRDRSRAEKNALSDVIYRADKASRACFSCTAQKQCDWKAARKNMEIRY